MIILIDIGNSRTKYVQLVNDKVSPSSQVSNENFTTRFFEENFAQANKVLLASVANSSFTVELSAWCQKRNINFIQVHSEQKKNALVSAYQKPATLGIDRWLALLGATRLYPQSNVLIIDAGTATTVDFVDNHGHHQGGWILAGIQALFNSILSHSTLVFAETKEKPSVEFGANTSDNVNNACWAATLGMVEQAIFQAQQLAQVEQVIFTGGNGQALADLLLSNNSKQRDFTINSIVIDDLIFYGLQEYCE